MAETTEKIEDTLNKLRSRSRQLRHQAYAGIGLIIVLVISLILTFTALHRNSIGQATGTKIRDPYDYRLMETRHSKVAYSIKEMVEQLKATNQEILTDKYIRNGAEKKAILTSLQDRIDVLNTVKYDIEDRLSRDVQNMNSEIKQLRQERDAALKDGAENGMMLNLVGEAAMRLGILILAIYLIAIISNFSKYVLRVADHLNSVADSLELLMVSGLSPERAIAALTPHPIDFHIDNVLSLRTIKELIPLFETGVKDSKLTN